MGEIFCLSGSVDNQKQALAAAFVIEPRDHQIIENIAVGIEQLRVAHLPWSKGCDVARHKPLQTARGIGCRKNRLAHVRNVEEPRLSPRMKMFADDARWIL